MSVEHVKLTMKIDSGNAALTENPREEIRRILEHFLDKLDSLYSFYDYSLRDANGNKVGYVHLDITDDEEEEEE